MSATYLQQYVFLGALGLAAIVMAILPLVLAQLVAPKKPSELKDAPYECGVESTGDSWIQFRVQYYLYALLFVIFDVEVVFIYPWAVIWKSLGLVAFVEMAVFIAILAIGLAYAWKKGVLEWH